MDVTHDAALGGRLRLAQPRRGHRFGHDAILLAAAVAARAGDRVVEFGAGVGAAGLALACRVGGIALTLIEVDPALSQLAASNISANGFDGRARAVTLDVTATPEDFDRAGLPAGSADHVMMNPPFNPTRLQPSPDAMRRRAHAAGRETLPTWIASAARLLRRGGILTLISRADDLDAILAHLRNEFGAATILPIRSVEDEPPIRVICRAVKSDRSAPAILPAFVLNDRERNPTRESEAVLRHAAPLPLAHQ
jgi:tRNA1(Val) A37 N6-methylase TrmN6